MRRCAGMIQTLVTESFWRHQKKRRVTLTSSPFATVGHVPEFAYDYFKSQQVFLNTAVSSNVRRFCNERGDNEGRPLSSKPMNWYNIVYDVENDVPFNVAMILFSSWRLFNAILGPVGLD